MKKIEKFGLPSTVALDETFGRLRKRYRFTLQDIRSAGFSLMRNSST
ncbi:MAG: hypothetical protein WCC06_08905 [Candidatus Aminicenantales bacterium]